jgi:hypothetical protein
MHGHVPTAGGVFAVWITLFDGTMPANLLVKIALGRKAVFFNF